MDLVDIIAEKRFLGQEFLTWLWYKSEERGGAVNLPDSGDITLVFEKYMMLEYGEGEACERVLCRGNQTELREARTSLAHGKKLEQAGVFLAKGDYEWRLNLVASRFEFRSVRLPGTLAQSEEESGDLAEEARIMERASLFEEAVHTVNELFRLFLNIRAGSGWPDEVAVIKAWIRKSAAAAGRAS